MPTYCVTGGTGLIASHLIKQLLKDGQYVRATVRDPDDEKKVGFLWSFDGAKERLSLVKADLMVENSFDEAFQGADGVFHVASPVFAAQENVQSTLIDPAIKGTCNVLKSCTKSNSMKRVVITSSCSAIRYRDDATLISPLNELHWSDTEYCKKYNLWYPFAKTITEKEAWGVAKEHNIDLVVVNPSFVVGPLITPQPTSTLQMILSIINGISPVYPNMTVGFVHIDDVVRAHIIAMENSKASGRLICSSSVAHWSEIVEMLRMKYPSYPLPNKYLNMDNWSIDDKTLVNYFEQSNFDSYNVEEAKNYDNIDFVPKTQLSEDVNYILEIQVTEMSNNNMIRPNEEHTSYGVSEVRRTRFVIEEVIMRAGKEAFAEEYTILRRRGL